MIYPPFFEQIDNGCWTRLSCPCGAVNWVYAGELDLEKIQCWKCKQEYWVDYDAYEACREDEGSASVEEGLEQPRL